METKDYCVSLEMAQRAELHEAMAAAGAGEAGVADHPGDGYSDCVWRVYKSSREERGSPFCGTRDYFCGFGYPVHATFYPAYHLGELWCAAVALAAKHPLAVNVQLDQAANGGGAQADICDIDAMVLSIHGNPHAPDALAELVIALHKAATDA